MAVKKVLSIQISDVVTKLCLVSYNKKTPVVYKSICFENPEMSVEDGFVIDRNVYETALQEQLSNNKIKCKDVVFVLSGTKIMSREVTIPDMKESLILGFIEDERDEYFPMDTSDYLFTYNILEEKKEEKQLRIMIYAAQDVLIKNYITLASELGLKLHAIDYEGNAIYQWQKKPSHEPCSIYLQINERNSMLTILEDNELALQRNMPFGIDALTSFMMASDCFENISHRNAIERLCEKELLFTNYETMMASYPENDDEVRLHELKCRLTETVRGLIENLTRALEYYNAKNRDAVVDKIVIGGVGAQIRNLRKLLQSEFIGIEFEKCLELPGAKIHRNNPVTAKRGTEFIACVGAAETTINFYDGQNKQKAGGFKAFCIISILLVMVAAGVIVYNGKLQYDRAEDERKKAERTKNELEATGIEEVEAEANRKAAIASEFMIWDDSTFRFNEQWNEVLKALETDSTENILVSSVSSSDTGLSMNLTVASKEEAAKLIEQLKFIPYFSSVSVYNITETENTETGMKSVAFTALCTYKQPEAEDNGEEAE